MVSGLKRMEYRGYDSVGIATKVENAVQIRKGVGRVDEVNKAENLDGLEGTVGIGHTRWATHGKELAPTHILTQAIHPWLQ